MLPVRFLPRHQRTLATAIDAHSRCVPARACDTALMTVNVAECVPVERLRATDTTQKSMRRDGLAAYPVHHEADWIVRPLNRDRCQDRCRCTCLRNCDCDSDCDSYFDFDSDYDLDWEMDCDDCFVNESSCNGWECSAFDCQCG